MRKEHLKEGLGKLIFGTAAAVCSLSVLAIFVFLIVKGLPALQKIGIRDFLLGTVWSPDRHDTYRAPLSGYYGIFTMIVGTLAVTAGALLIGGVLGYFTAVFLVFFCPKSLRGSFAAVIHLLAGIPSVVYGFFGISFLLPLISRIAPNNGSGLFAGSLILGVMILPTVVAVSQSALEAVPTGYYDASTALGASHTQTVFRVMVPAARAGITASLILGIGRALGETMAIVMVAGNSPTYPKGFFHSFRVLTANIVMEMGYAGEVQEGALVATGVVLLVFVFLINLGFALLSGRGDKKRSAKKAYMRQRARPRLPAYFPQTTALGKLFSVFSAFFCGAILLLILGFIFVKGVPTLLSDRHLLFGKYEFGGERITVFPSLIATLMAVVLSLAVAVPLGVMTAIFLHEYTQKKSFFVRLIRGAVDTLGGVPSIVYGLFGFIAFVPIFGGSSSVLAGSLTVSLMLLPTVVRTTEESLAAVPEGLREGSLALGAGKLRTIRRLVLPSALSGIFSGVILSIGRVVGESAPFLYTMGSVITAIPRSYLESGATLSVALYQLAGEGWHIKEAYATAVVLILLVLGLNLSARSALAHLRKKTTQGKERRSR